MCYLSLRSAVNIMHLFALLIVVVVGVDYGIYHTREGRVEGARSAILFSTLTTLFSFGFFLFSQTRALNSFGEVICLVHGEAVAYALPAVLKLVAPIYPQKVKEIGKILGADFNGDESPEKIGEITVKAYKNFRDNVIGLHPFADYGIGNDELVKDAEEIVNERFAGNTPVKLTKENVSELLENFG